MTDRGMSPGWNVAAAEVWEVMGIPPGAIMTDEQAAEFRERFAATMDAAARRLRSPAEAELAKINEILREHGFEYPLGARGVQDLAAGYRVRQEELHTLDPEHWAAV